MLTDRQITNLFTQLDATNSGLIDAFETLNTLASLNCKAPQRKVNQILDTLGLENNKLDINGFIRFFKLIFPDRCENLQVFVSGQGAIKKPNQNFGNFYKSEDPYHVSERYDKDAPVQKQEPVQQQQQQQKQDLQFNNVKYKNQTSQENEALYASYKPTPTSPKADSHQQMNENDLQILFNKLDTQNKNYVLVGDLLYVLASQKQPFSVLSLLQHLDQIGLQFSVDKVDYKTFAGIINAVLSEK